MVQLIYNCSVIKAPQNNLLKESVKLVAIDQHYSVL